MDCKATRIPYRQTHAFSRIVTDYIDQAETVKDFFANPPTIKGIQNAIESRKNSNTDRSALVNVLKQQYQGLANNSKVLEAIESLKSSQTFTITTAHQNNIFTGPLYFIYKIVHALKLSAHLNKNVVGYRFVPVFYMGSEDADLEELNHIHLGGEKLSWNTKQTGAVGRMIIDQDLVKLIDKMQGQLSVMPHGSEMIDLLTRYYKPGVTVQNATLEFVHHLFGEYGLVVLIADHPDLKRQMQNVFEDDLLNQTASGIVQTTAKRLEAAGYKIQAHPREINLFYLEEDRRERLQMTHGEWSVVNGSISFDKSKILQTLRDHPERFSPNVILRGIYQETILPNVAFIGGGGELAYWLQLKDLFYHYKIPFPVLVLRNSFLLLEEKWREKIAHLGLDVEDFFLPEQEIMNKWVLKESKTDTRLNGSLTELENLYELFKKQAKAVDLSLERHVDALKVRTMYRLQELEKKMLRAEKRKFADQQRQIHTIKSHLFPGNGLQERHNNLSYYYALYGNKFLAGLYDHSPALEQEFTILNCK